MKIIDGSQIETIEETIERWVVCALHWDEYSILHSRD